MFEITMTDLGMVKFKCGYFCTLYHPRSSVNEVASQKITVINPQL